MALTFFLGLIRSLSSYSASQGNENNSLFSAPCGNGTAELLPGVGLPVSLDAAGFGSSAVFWRFGLVVSESCMKFRAGSPFIDSGIGSLLLFFDGLSSSAVVGKGLARAFSRQVCSVAGVAGAVIGLAGVAGTALGLAGVFGAGVAGLGVIPGVLGYPSTGKPGVP